ncbi:zinc finger protein 511 [Rhinophrynus dorsalis]
MLSAELVALLSSGSTPNFVELPVERRLLTVDSLIPRRVRFTRDHEFFEDGDVQRHLYLQDVLTNIGEVKEKPRVSMFKCETAGCTHVFDTIESYEHHYNTLHRNVCSSCKRSFPSARLLDIHILEWHDSFFQVMSEKANMYQCLVEGCAEKFKTGAERKDHLIKSHLYPPDFRFDKPKKAKSKNKQGKSTVKCTSMDIVTCEGLAVESMEVCSSQSSDGAIESCSTANCKNASNTHSKYRVPSTICFGHGSVRGFRHTKKNK